MIVYLAGPIAHGSYEEATRWRNYATRRLGEYGIQTLDPMRHKEFLTKVEVIDATAYTDPVSTQRGIITRDRNDVFRTSMMLLNLSGAEKVSIGSMVELGWASERRIPIITVMSEGNIHDHVFVRELSSFIVDSLDQAIDIIRKLV